MMTESNHPMRKFDTGATRDTSENKPEYLGFLSWRALRRFGAYMMKHQIQANGEKREADNWKKGIPIPVYEHSLTRHFQEWAEALERQKEKAGDGFAHDVAMDAALAMMFNLQGWIHEVDRYQGITEVRINARIDPSLFRVSGTKSFHPGGLVGKSNDVCPICDGGPVNHCACVCPK